MPATALGVDWHKRGWVAVVLRDGRAPEVLVGEDLAELVARAPDAGAALAPPKTTWNGQHQRRALLAGQGIVLPDELGEAGRVPPADVLDAAAAAWSARRHAAGQSEWFPRGPRPRAGEAIWF